MRKELDSAWWMLRIGFGLAPALAGLDKIFRTTCSPTGRPTSARSRRRSCLGAMAPVSVTAHAASLGM
jgi:hypothetical protein